MASEFDLSDSGSERPALPEDLDQFDVEDDQRDHLGGPAAEPAPRHEAPDAVEALRQVVNKEFVQRFGDMVVRPDDKHDGSRWNAWAAEATLRTAFGTSSPVGRSRQSVQAKGGGRATHVGQAGHGGQVLDTKVVVTTAALEAQSAAWERTLGTMMGQGRRHPWMVIERAWDETVSDDLVLQQGGCCVAVGLEFEPTC